MSTWSTDRGICLGQLKVEDKSNEITAIPEILDAIDIKGSTVTIDAMGEPEGDCRSHNKEKKGHYVLSLKENQRSFYERVEEAFNRGLETHFKNRDYSFHQTRNKSHGRVEERNYFKIDDIDFLNRSKEWAGLSAIGLVESILTRNNNVTLERRYYITSLKSDAEQFGEAVRKHWQVENNLYWVLDVQFGDDNAVKRERNSATHFSVVKRAVINLLKQTNPERNRRKKWFEPCVTMFT